MKFDPIDNFTGSFNGQDYVITGLYINRPDGSGVGLWTCDMKGTVKNVGLEDMDVKGDERVDGLFGVNSGKELNSYATWSVKGDESYGEKYVDGLLVYNEGEVPNSYS